MSGRQPSWSAEPRQVQPGGAPDDHTPITTSTGDGAAPDASQQVAHLEPNFGLLTHHQLELPEREWIDEMDNFRASYVNELPLLKDENANLKAQLETAVSRIGALEQQFKELLESITGSRATELEPKPANIDLAEKVNSEAVM